MLSFYSRANKSDHNLEKGKLILQIGTSDPETAVQAAKVVENDVDAIDVNMGCPKKFSTQGGMGAALLANQETACAIISRLSSTIKVPITAKIRLLDTIADTISFIKKLETAGASIITVHLRQRGVESTVPAADTLVMQQLVQATSIPLIANGDLYTHEDIAAMFRDSGCAGVMLGRPGEVGVDGGKSVRGGLGSCG